LDIAADGGGDALVTGYTLPSDWASGGFDTSHNGECDAFVGKLSSAGAHLWSTYLGGSSDDYGSGIAVDGGGNVLVTGGTGSSGWVSGGFDTSHNGEGDAFVAKLSSQGAHLWSTYLGGTDVDAGDGIAVNAAGNVVVAGTTLSSGWVSGGFDTSQNGSCDAFVAELSSAGAHLWSTYLGGSAGEWAEGIALDGSGNVFVAGWTHSSGWVSGGFDTSYNGLDDGFVAKIVSGPQFRVSSIAPSSGPRTTRGKVAGTGFGVAAGWLKYTPDGGLEMDWEVLSWSDAEIAFRVPAATLIGPGAVKVVRADGGESNEVAFEVTDPATIHVDDSNTTGVENGTPEHPFNTIQEGIDAATDGDEVLVHDGTYTGDGNRDLDFWGKSIALRSQNGPDACTIDCESTEEDPHRGFYFHRGEDENAIVDGFTIINGWARSVATYGEVGGGILCLNSSPTITGNKIILCWAHDGGGGIYCDDFASPAIANNTLYHNCSARGGGGIYCERFSSTIANNTICENMSAGGAGIPCVRSSGTIINNTFSGNSADHSGGAISFYLDSGTTLTNNTIVGNCSRYGAGIACNGSAPTLRNNTVADNRANSIGGGVLCILGSSPTMTNCILWANLAPNGNQIASCNWGEPAGLTVAYCDVAGGETGAYLETGCTLNWGAGNIDADPLFAAPGQRDDNGTPDNFKDDVWSDGDYHLKSQAGRYDPSTGTWVIDTEHSPCIDAGQPDTTPPYDWAGEPEPNGARINMGAYGGTDEASMSRAAGVLTATVELEGYTGSPGALLTLRFAFTDAGGTVLERRNVQVAYTNGRDTETVVLDQIPEGAVRVSCKEIQHFLRRRVDIAGTAPDLTADFTEDNQLLGGDLKDDNFVELTDFAQFLRDFGRADRPETDINGDGVVERIARTPWPADISLDVRAARFPTPDVQEVHHNRPSRAGLLAGCSARVLGGGPEERDPVHWRRDGIRAGHSGRHVCQWRGGNASV